MIRLTNNFDNSLFIAGTVITAGNFDGPHAGHMLLFEKTTAYAKENGLKSVFFSFRPHPARVLRGENFRLITTYEERAALIVETGVDFFVEYPFDRAFAETAPGDFLDLLFGGLNCKCLILGEDFRFGKNGSGRIEDFAGIAAARGVEIIIVPHLTAPGGEKICSSAVRRFIAERNFAAAEEFLRRPYQISGEVVRGKGRGAGLGFPSANIIPGEIKLLPPAGVYAALVLRGGAVYNGITNIGTNPTFGENETTVETFIFDFDRNIYGEEITLRFVEFMREEKRFASAAELSEQLERDRETARRILR